MMKKSFVLCIVLAVLSLGMRVGEAFVPQGQCAIIRHHQEPSKPSPLSSCLFGTRKNLDHAWTSAVQRGEGPLTETTKSALLSVQRCKERVLAKVISTSSSLSLNVANNDAWDVTEEGIEQAAREFESLAGLSGRSHSEAATTTGRGDSSAAFLAFEQTIQEAEVTFCRSMMQVEHMMKEAVKHKLDSHKSPTYVGASSDMKQKFIPAVAQAVNQFHDRMRATEQEYANSVVAVAQTKEKSRKNILELSTATELLVADIASKMKATPSPSATLSQNAFAKKFSAATRVVNRSSRTGTQRLDDGSTAP